MWSLNYFSNYDERRLKINRVSREVSKTERGKGGGGLILSFWDVLLTILEIKKKIAFFEASKAGSSLNENTRWF